MRRSLSENNTHILKNRFIRGFTRRPRGHFRSTNRVVPVINQNSSDSSGLLPLRTHLFFPLGKTIGVMFNELPVTAASANQEMAM